MDEFPDPDEEFDLIESNVYEIPKQSQENIQNLTSNDFTSEKSSLWSKENVNNGPLSNLDSVPNTDRNGDSSLSRKKRTYEELLEEYQDIFMDEKFAYVPDVKDKKPRWNEPDAVIELILKERKKHKISEKVSKTFGKDSTVRSGKDSISTSIPSWNFVVLTRLSDYQRIYVRVRERKNNIPVRSCPASGLFGIPFSQMKNEAEEIILRNCERASSSEPVENSTKSDGLLWVDKYRPSTYMELLTDESVNRACLRWLKLWDKIVFNREIVKRKKPAANQTFGYKKFPRKTEDEGIDSRGFPIQRIALLSGPPGLGKTTLAHLVAKHAGYNVVEINASDDRGPEAFREALLAATEMRSLMGNDPKPNCLILDEIDGASAASIDLLIKYVQGKLLPKGKKNKDAGKNSDGCKRPVICICNEAYTPSLRPLRSMAFIIPVPKVNAVRLADRLATIAQQEHLKTDQGALLQLAERSGCDVRSCLCALQYMGEARDGSNLSLGLKDSKRGLFDCWKDVLQVPMARGGLVPMRERVEIVLKAAHSGESERMAQGVFHNYPETCPPKMDVISETLEWYQLYDKITTVVATRQDWRVMPYTNYAFVAWHFGFASTQFLKLSYPYAPSEANQKLNKNISMLRLTKQTYNRDIETLVLDITPFLPELLTPRLRSVSGHLYSPNERADLARLVNVLLELGLSFVQTKSDDRSFDYTLDPNLFEIGIFPDCKVRRSMPYAVKQIVAQELETERVRRAAMGRLSSQNQGPTENEVIKKKTTNDTNTSVKPAVPNHLRELKSLPVQSPETKYRNFFENFVSKTSAEKQKSPGTSPRGAKSIHRFRRILTKHGVWYKYKEGFSNSVRRDIKICDLL